MHINKPHTLIRIATVPGTFALQLNGQVAYMMQNGWEVQVISSPAAQWFSWPPDIPKDSITKISIRRHLSPLADATALWRIWKIIRQIKPQVVHTHSPKAGLLGMLAAWLCRVPVRIHTLAGTPLSTATGNKKNILFFSEWLTAACATHIWVNAPSLLRWGVSQGFLPQKKSRVLLQGSTNGVDLKLFDPSRYSDFDKHNLLVNHKISKEATIWLFVGRVVAEKGIVELLQAFEKIQEIFPDQVLVCIGPLEQERDPIGNEWVTLLHEHPNIRYIQWSDEIPLWMATATALVHPSYREGLPNVLLEAGAMGCPILASLIDGNTDLITDQSFGYLFPARSFEYLYDAMFRFLVEPPEIKIEKTRKLQQHIHLYFDRSRMHEEIFRQYEQLIQKQDSTV